MKQFGFLIGLLVILLTIFFIIDMINSIKVGKKKRIVLYIIGMFILLFIAGFSSEWEFIEDAGMLAGPSYLGLLLFIYVVIVLIIFIVKYKAIILFFSNLFFRKNITHYGLLPAKYKILSFLYIVLILILLCLGIWLILDSLPL